MRSSRATTTFVRPAPPPPIALAPHAAAVFCDGAARTFARVHFLQVDSDVVKVIVGVLCMLGRDRHRCSLRSGVEQKGVRRRNPLCEGLARWVG